ncbi:MAG: acyltransferase [Bacteroidota bacterium]|nr:acyltransferase [Bacteroidota bacterium]
MDTKTNAYLITLTPLRGIAALLVVIFHCNLMLNPFMPPGYTHFVESGWMWVDFFFVLSGFIMTYVYGKYFKDGTAWGPYKKFIGARFARVYPLHLFTLIWAIICAIIIVKLSSSLDPFFADMFNFKTAASASLVLIQSLHLFTAAPLNTPSWSLSTEWWVYTIFPLFVPFFDGIKTKGKIIALLFLVAFFLFIRYYIGPLSGPFKGTPQINIVADFGFIRRLAGFLAGMLLFEFYKAKTGYSILKRSGSFVLFFTATLIMMHFGIMDLIIISMFPFILISAAYNDTTLKKILDTRPLQRLGDWSFSIYMVHVPLMMLYWIYLVKKDPTYFSDLMKMVSSKPNYALGVVLCIVVVAATLVLASFTYRYVEVPSRNYLNKLFDARHKKIAVEGVKV